MSTWKDQAKKAIGKNKLTRALQIMKKNGINCAKFVEPIEFLHDLETKVLAEKRQYTSAEHAKSVEVHMNVMWAMIQAIDGTNKPLPSYLKP
jgi:hypothetical protein